MSWELVVKHKFAAAHYLQHYQGKCEHMHGHTFEMEVYLRTETLNASGISIDFTELKGYLQTIAPDHQVLNEVFDFSPSAENLARHFYQRIREKYPVRRVMVWESEHAGASYSED